MNEIVHIGNADISVKEYRGQRVVTLSDIDAVHSRPDGTARRNFNTNKKRFIAGEDYFVVGSDEIRTSRIFPISDNDFMDKTLITESGYLMLVKSFTDDLAWEIQRQLVSSYFKVRQTVDERLSPETKMLFQMINQIATSEIKAKEAKELAEHFIVPFRSAENGKLEQWLDAKTLGEYKKIVVETDEENPTTIATITPNARNAITGYRVRMIPVYEKAGDK